MVMMTVMMVGSRMVNLVETPCPRLAAGTKGEHACSLSLPPIQVLTKHIGNVREPFKSAPRP
eukprot:11576445-Karenia_brevis.AAC.1